MMSKFELSGLVPPLITPLTRDHQIDLSGLNKLLSFLIAEGVNGVFILGSSGEGAALKNEKKAVMIEQTVKICKGRIKVLVGALDSSTEKSLEIGQIAEQNQADAIVITNPYYTAASQREMENHANDLCSSINRPVMFYSISSATHNILEIDTLEKLLSQNDNLIGIKDSSGDMFRFCQLLDLKREHPDFLVFQGAENLADLALIKGADGLVSGLGNVIPGLLIEMYSAVKESKDFDRALKIQERINAVGTLHQQSHWLGALKKAVSLVAGTEPFVLSPVEVPSSAESEKIKEILQKNKII